MEVRGAQRAAVIARNNIKAQAESIELPRRASRQPDQARIGCETSRSTPRHDRGHRANHADHAQAGDSWARRVARTTARRTARRNYPAPADSRRTPTRACRLAVRLASTAAGRAPRRAPTRRCHRAASASRPRSCFRNSRSAAQPACRAERERLFTAGQPYWSFGPTVTWRILDFGRIRCPNQSAPTRGRNKPSPPTNKPSSPPSEKSKTRLSPTPTSRPAAKP